MTKVINMRPWVDSNPMRVYRTRHKISLNHCAALIGVSRTALTNWEEGASTPTDKNFEVLERIIPGITRAWKDWDSKRPRA